MRISTTLSVAQIRIVLGMRAMHIEPADLIDTRLRVATWNVWWRFGPWEERQPAIAETAPPHRRRRDRAAGGLGRRRRSGPVRGAGGRARLPPRVRARLRRRGGMVRQRGPVALADRGERARATLPTTPETERVPGRAQSRGRRPAGPVRALHDAPQLAVRREPRPPGAGPGAGRVRGGVDGSPVPAHRVRRLQCRARLRRDPDAHRARRRSRSRASCSSTRGTWPATGPGSHGRTTMPFAARDLEADRRIDYVFVGWRKARGAGHVVDGARRGDRARSTACTRPTTTRSWPSCGTREETRWIIDLARRCRSRRARHARLARRDPGDRLGLTGKAECTKSCATPCTTSSTTLHERLWAEAERSVLLVLQGVDTSGKDGVIRRVLTGLNPQGCSVDELQGADHPRARARLPLARARRVPGSGTARRVQPVALRGRRRGARARDRRRTAVAAPVPAPPRLRADAGATRAPPS